MLGPLALVLLLLWGFAGLAEAVVDGSTEAADAWMVRQLRTDDPSDPVGPAWFEEVARDVTALGSNVVLAAIVLATAGYLALSGRTRPALLLVGFVALGFALVYLLKLGFERPRPELVPHGQAVWTSSFPSGHSMAAALVFLTLAALLGRVEARRRVRAYLLFVALILTGAVGLSRVYLGVHYPSDVLGGWAVGTAWAVLTWLAVDALARRGRLEGAESPP